MFGTLGQLLSEIPVILLVLPLDFSALFLVISIVFMNIHENSKQIICISNYHIQVLYLQINLIPDLLF